MKLSTNIPYPNVTDGRKFTVSTPADYKSALVNLGACALARCEWAIVRAITHLIQARGWHNV